MEIEIVRLVQSISSDFLDAIFWVITKLGEDTIFLLALVGIYLFYDKKFAIKYSVFYLLSVGVNTIVKSSIKRPRPYVASDLIKNRLPASNYSFPSGHSQGYFIQASTMSLEINNKLKNKKWKIFWLIALTLVGIAVMISRLYWGQHYLTDVLIGAIFGITLAVIFEHFFNLISKKLKGRVSDRLIYFIVLNVSLFVATLFFVLQLTLGFVSTKVYKFCGIFISLGIGCLFESRFLINKNAYSIKQKIIQGIVVYSVILVLYLIIINLIDLQGIIYFVVYLIFGLICSIIMPLLFNLIFNKRDKINGNNC